MLKVKSFRELCFFLVATLICQASIVNSGNDSYYSQLASEVGRMNGAAKTTDKNENKVSSAKPSKTKKVKGIPYLKTFSPADYAKTKVYKKWVADRSCQLRMVWVCCLGENMIAGMCDSGDGRKGFRYKLPDSTDDQNTSSSGKGQVILTTDWNDLIDDMSKEDLLSFFDGTLLSRDERKRVGLREEVKSISSESGDILADEPIEGLRALLKTLQPKECRPEETKTCR